MWLAAPAIRLAVSTGWETSEAWLDGAKAVAAPMRFAMNRCNSGLIMWSSVETRNQEGFEFHAGADTGAPKQFFFETGF